MVTQNYCELAAVGVSVCTVDLSGNGRLGVVVKGGLAGMLMVLLTAWHCTTECSDRLAAPFAGADANAIVQRQHEDLAVADFT